MMAAAELGLRPGTAVAASLIDAYAGALGTLGVGDAGAGMQGRMALVAGTSTCHIGLSVDPSFTQGVWGPYLSVLTPGLWANEAGLSVAGALLDRILQGYAYAGLQETVANCGGSIYDQLHAFLDDLTGSADDTHLYSRANFKLNRTAALADRRQLGAV